MTSLPLHARVPASRPRVGAADLLVMQRACVLIAELGSELDARLVTELQPAERTRLLRITTNRITRAANDAIAAYGRARRAVNAAVDRDDAGRDDALAMRERLRAARLELLSALELANRRYPTSDVPAESGPPA